MFHSYINLHLMTCFELEIFSFSTGLAVLVKLGAELSLGFLES
jgi:hypothetical protein